MRMTCFVDASHAGDLVKRRSHTGFIIYLKNSPIVFYSKRQNTVETSTFGAKLVTMQIAIETIRTLQTKLHLLGILVEEHTYILGDNESVVNITSTVETKLNKKHQAIYWHTIREASATG